MGGLFPAQEGDHIANTYQLYPYLEMGAAGIWNHDLWSGPWPVLAAWNAAKAGDVPKTRAIMKDMMGVGAGGDGDATRYGNHTMHEYAGYINIGPPRPPFAWGLRDPEADAKAVERSKKRAERWLALCEKYRPQVEASGVAPI